MTGTVVVLAAGASTRMGHPKALTPLGGATALERMVAACGAAGFPGPVVVTGAHHDEIRAALPGLGGRVRWVQNHRPEMGRTGSLQRGLAASPGGWVLAWPVDHPLVAPETLRRLAEAPGWWVVPEHRGRGGHPIKLDGPGRTAVETAPPAMPLRGVPAAVGLQVTRLPVDDPGVLENLDTPGDVDRAWHKGI